MVYGNKELYDLSDVIFGLRVKYQKVERNLQELKQYAKLDDKYGKLHFNVHNGYFNYDYSIKNRDFGGLTDEALFGSPLQKDKDSYCSDEILEIVDKDNFNALAKDILDDGFADAIELSTCFKNRFNNKQIIEIDIHSGSIHVFLNNITKLKRPLTMAYYAMEDMISINKKMGILTKKDIYNLFMIKVPGDELSNYHIDLIDYANNSKSIEVMMGKEFRSSCDLDIIEESDNFVLQKKKSL